MRIEINCDNLNNLLSTVSTGGIAKTLGMHDFIVKNKNLV